MSHKYDLQSVLHGDFTSVVAVIHQEEHQIEELSRFQSTRIDRAPLVHGLKLLLADHPVQIIINLPDHLLQLAPRGVRPQEVEHLVEVVNCDLVHLIGLLIRLKPDQLSKDSVEMDLLNAFDLDLLENLSRALSQFLHS